METYTKGEVVYALYRNKWRLARVESVHGQEAYTVKFYNDEGEQRLFMVGDAGERLKPFRTSLNSSYASQNTGRAA